MLKKLGSWGLSLFVLFEPFEIMFDLSESSWGLSLFVLFELYVITALKAQGSWGLSLFVLFELQNGYTELSGVLEG